ncbi:MAG: hypothetical protein IKM01_05045, partial [Clostridia bacterium]|nr:hypothetical protein [Clostridia bacterium]
MNKETLISVISKMIDCGQISIQAVQALSSLGYVDAKRVLEICKNNNLVVESDDKELVPCVTTDELYALIDNNAIDL